jgi:hypothetical protein
MMAPVTRASAVKRPALSSNPLVAEMTSSS